MKIVDKDLDAIELIHDIKKQMKEVRELIAALEYVIYQKDERVEINFFERGEDDA